VVCSPVVCRKIPTITNGNINAHSMMIEKRAADLIGHGQPTLKTAPLAPTKAIG
jgi:hypothetical protein